MRNRAFSLVELLFVMVIIAIVTALTLPAFNSMGKAQALSSAGTSLLDTFALARQVAVAQNRVVELRFYRRLENPAQPAGPSNPEKFRSFRIMINTDVWNDAKKEWVSVATPQTTMQDFPTRIVLNEDAKYSSLIHPYVKGSPAGYEGRLVKTKTDADYQDDSLLAYQFIRFKPTGSVDLPTTGTPATGGTGVKDDRWFLTIQSENPEKDIPKNRPANNYTTILLDPVSGRVRTYRP